MNVLRGAGIPEAERLPHFQAWRRAQPLHNHAIGRQRRYNLDLHLSKCMTSTMASTYERERSDSSSSKHFATWFCLNHASSSFPVTVFVSWMWEVTNSMPFHAWPRTIYFRPFSFFFFLGCSAWNIKFRLLWWGGFSSYFWGFFQRWCSGREWPRAGLQGDVLQRSEFYLNSPTKFFLMITYSLQDPILVLDNQLRGDCVRPCSFSLRHWPSVLVGCSLGSWTPNSR